MCSGLPWTCGRYHTDTVKATVTDHIFYKPLNPQLCSDFWDVCDSMPKKFSLFKLKQYMVTPTKVFGGKSCLFIKEAVQWGIAQERETANNNLGKRQSQTKCTTSWCDVLSGIP